MVRVLKATATARVVHRSRMMREPFQTITTKFDVTCFLLFLLVM